MRARAFFIAAFIAALWSLPAHAPPTCNSGAEGTVYHNGTRPFNCDGSVWQEMDRARDPDLVAGNIANGVQITNGSQTITGTAIGVATDADLVAGNIKSGISISTGVQSVTGTLPYKRNKTFTGSNLDTTISSTTYKLDNTTNNRKAFCVHHGRATEVSAVTTSQFAAALVYGYIAGSTRNVFPGDTGVFTYGRITYVTSITCNGYY